MSDRTQRLRRRVQQQHGITPLLPTIARQAPTPPPLPDTATTRRLAATIRDITRRVQAEQAA